MSYSVLDRFKEISSYEGIFVGIVGNIVPNVIHNDAWTQIITLLATFYGAAKFFMPDNAVVKALGVDAALIAAELAKALPPPYAATLAVVENTVAAPVPSATVASQPQS